MSQKALLVIDMQRGIFEDTAYVLENQDQLFAVVNQAIEKAREKDLPVLFVQHTEKQGLVEFSSDWQLDLRLNREQNDFVFSKHHSDAFWDTKLKSYCDNHDINELIICGVQTEYCVDTTVRSAHRLGFKVNLISDGHSSVKNQVLTVDQIIRHHNETLSGFADVQALKDLEF